LNARLSSEPVIILMATKVQLLADDDVPVDPSGSVWYDMMINGED
jgi:hypothetical protein